MRFRIDQLMFATFVIAICGSIFRVAPLAGAILSLPILLAATRSLQFDKASGLVSLTHSFLIRNVIQLALVIITLVWLAVFFSALSLNAIRLACLSVQWILRSSLIGLCALLMRFIGTTLVAFIVRGWALSKALSHSLSRTNRSLYLRWSL